MIVVALDLSSKPGYAILRGGKRLASGTSRPKRALDHIQTKYPFNYVEFSAEVVELLIERVNFHLNSESIHPYDVNAIVIEETTASHQNYSQKVLEFVHKEFLEKSRSLYKNAEYAYIRDGVWKSACGATMNKAEKNNNAKISRLKKSTGKKIIRKDKKGNVLRKVTTKDAYIRCANDLFGLGLTREDEDQAAALLLAVAYTKKVPLCDGKVTGGLRVKPGLGEGLIEALEEIIVSEKANEKSEKKLIAAKKTVKKSTKKKPTKKISKVVKKPNLRVVKGD